MPRVDYDSEWGDWLEKTHDPDAREYFAFRDVWAGEWDKEAAGYYLPQEGSRLPYTLDEEGTQHEQQPGTAGPAYDTLAEQTDTDR